MSTIQPENFKEICESVLEESDGRAVQLASVSLGRDTNGDLYLTKPTHRNVVKWVADEYVRIQMLSPFWEFHHKRGTFLNVAAAKQSYKKAGIREADKDSLYFIKTGETARYPMYCQPYDWWQYQQQVDATSTASIPTTIVEGPDDEWIVWPISSAAGAIYGDWWVKPYELVDADDAPCWNIRYYPLIKWGVMGMYASEFAGEGSADKLITRARRMLPPLQLAFERDYLPKLRGAPTLF